MSDDIFPGQSEMARRMRTFDWSGTALGPTDDWPQSLRTSVSTCLDCAFPIILWWGPELSILYNDEYRHILGPAKHPAALGQPGAGIWAEVWDIIGPMLSQVYQRGEAIRARDLLLQIDRGYLEEAYFSFSYSPIHVEGGRIGGVFCPVIETTEKVIGERRLRTLRDLAAKCKGAANEARVYDAAATILGDNPRDVPFVLIYRIDEAQTEARRQSLAGIDPGTSASPEHVTLDGRTPDPWSLSSVAQSGQSVLLTGLSSRFDVLPSGAWKTAPASALVLPVLLPGQERPRAILVAAISPMRALDDDYRTFFELIATQIASAVADAQALEHERRRAESLAELDRAKTTFFSNVSHEFRTPLTLMLGPLEELRSGIPSALRPEDLAVVDLAYRNSLRLLKLVNTLLDFSRVEAGRASARFEAVDLCALTKDLASTFQSVMDRAGLDFRIECTPFADPVYVDRVMWETIVLNLVSNAFKFTLQGSVVVSVMAQDHHALLAVQDTGVGIPEQELPRVFDRFHRVQGVEGRSHEGSGIGLALVRELVKSQGGTLAVESRNRSGSRFTVSMPMGSAHLSPEQIQPPEGTPQSPVARAYVEEALRWLPATTDTRPSEGASETLATAARILVADDNADMRDYARRLLSERWTVDTVSNGREALAAARARRPDLIVADVMMPALDGFGLLKALRADPDLETVPVVLVSARAGEEARLEGLAASADDYLTKPFSARDLVARVDAQLIKARTRALERGHAQRLVNLFTLAPVAIAVVHGPEHVFELANAKYVELIGGREVLGKSVREAFPELAGQGILQLLDHARETGESYVGYSQKITLNRGPLGEPEDGYFDFIYQPVFDGGRPDKIVVVAHDVTALAEAKHEAETANRLKDEFLATLSHELRTPLNAVLGYTQMLRAGVIGPERLPAVLETIERNAKLQEQLVSDVLDVSRIITGKLRLDLRSVDLAQVIHDALDTVAPAAAAKGVILQPMTLQPGVPVAGDAQRLQQVVWNLLANAVKFTPRDGRVEIRLHQVKDTVEIVVSDTGEGIAPTFLPHVFQRFQQADGTFTRAHSGLGLGLAISRHLVEAHGGHIDATSPGEGQGTTVRVVLPLMIVHDAARETGDRVHHLVEVQPVPDLALVDLTGIRVLLVDDDVDALAMAKEVLTAAKATVITASSAAEALSAVDSTPVDVGVLDVGMPKVDGYQLLHAIRQCPQTRHLPVAALTAYARPVDRTRSLKAGFLLHLSKPVPPAELAAAVFTLAKSKRHA